MTRHSSFRLVMAHSVCISVLAISLLPQAALADRDAAEDAVEAGNTSYFELDYTQAESHYTTAISEDPTWEIPYNNRGLTRLKLGLHGQAEVDFAEAIAINDEYLAPLLNRAKCYAAREQWANAITDINNVLAIEPTNAKALYNLAWIQDEQEDYTNAITNYQAAITADPDHTRAKLGLAISRAKDAQTSQSVSDFYTVINEATAGDFNVALAAYNLQLLRGPGLSFVDSQAAVDYQDALLQFALENYSSSISLLITARGMEPALADIPWMLSWAYLKTGDDQTATDYLQDAYLLMTDLTVTGMLDNAAIYFDGIQRGTTPATVHLFASAYDLSLRHEVDTEKREWLGVAYTDGTAGGDEHMILNPMVVTDYTAFGPIADADRDCLADTWEDYWFGTYSYGPGDDATDYDNVINLYEHWASISPHDSDTDGDGYTDYDELFIYHTDPARATIVYFVNDALLDNDIWCSAAGNDANDGTSPSTPKATVQSILATYDLAAGDVVLIDTGTYSLSSNIVVGDYDSGTSDASVVFMVSPYGVVFDRGDTSLECYGWQLSGSYIELTTASSNEHPGAPQSYMQVTGANIGVNISGDHCELRQLRASGNYWYGILISSDSADNNVIEQCLTTGNYNGSGIYVSSADSITIRNCTVAGNAVHGVRLSGSSGSVLENNIIVADGEGDYCVYASGSLPTSDYNNLHAINGAHVGYWNGPQTLLVNWRGTTNQDVHSLSCDPLFVDAGTGDYHLGQGSCGIDTGIGDAGNEPTPRSTPLHGVNTGQRNMGGYGGTAHGASTPTGRHIHMYEPIGGETYYDQGAPIHIRWTWVGSSWQTGDTVALGFSSDSGTSWQDIADGQTVVVDAVGFSWDVVLAPSSKFYRVLIESNDLATAMASSDRDFQVGLGGLVYFVNDGYVENDIWCDAVGDDANDGTTPSTPKATVQSVLAMYDLEAGDVVLIDTGTYALSSEIVVGEYDSGSSIAPMVIKGSPYGVVFDRGNTSTGSYGWKLVGSYIELTTASSSEYPGAPQSYMQVTGANIGVNISGDHCRLSRLQSSNNYWYGILVSSDSADNNMIEQCLATDNYGGSGIYVSSGDSITIRNCTIAGNAKHGVRLSGSTGSILENNIIVADGEGDYCIYVSDPLPMSDYNDLYAINGAHVGYYGTPQTLLVDWRQATGLDTSSLSCDPLFVDASNGDYHLESIQGRYNPLMGLPPDNPAAWNTDTETSLAIDAVKPGYPLGEEPAQNNVRINMGAYGGTIQASIPPVGWSNIADMNNDHMVDDADYQLLRSQWLDNSNYPAADLNRDGEVNVLDYSIMCANWLWSN